MKNILQNTYEKSLFSHFLLYLHIFAPLYVTELFSTSLSEYQSEVCRSSVSIRKFSS